MPGEMTPGTSGGLRGVPHTRGPSNDLSRSQLRRFMIRQIDAQAKRPDEITLDALGMAGPHATVNAVVADLGVTGRRQCQLPAEGNCRPRTAASWPGEWRCPASRWRVAAFEDAARTMPPGEPGELMVRGPIVMQGYYGNDEATRETIEPDRWLHTGDVAVADNAGYFRIVDRRKDMIITTGYNVYPAEIEGVLVGHPAVVMSAVGAVRFATELPNPSTGKIMRRELRALD